MTRTKGWYAQGLLVTAFAAATALVLLHSPIQADEPTCFPECFLFYECQEPEEDCTWVGYPGHELPSCLGTIECEEEYLKMCLAGPCVDPQ